MDLSCIKGIGEARRTRRKTQDTTQSLGPTHFWSQVATVMWSPTTMFFSMTGNAGANADNEQTCKPSMWGACACVHLCMKVEEWKGVGRSYSWSCLWIWSEIFCTPCNMNVSPLLPSDTFPQVIFLYQKPIHYINTSLLPPLECFTYTYTTYTLFSYLPHHEPSSDKRPVSPYMSCTSATLLLSPTTLLTFTLL